MKKPLKPCAHSGCTKLTRESHCEEHKQVKQDFRKRYEKERGSAAERGYGHRWRKARETFLKRNPLCVCQDCQRRMVPLPANVVDHITPHKGDMVLFWDKNNWQPMNKQCHDKKTAREDGGFGNV